ncbi:MAG: zinc dependent phospholipase C family protein [Promethearchaeota archaeon]|jgi:hypothetical protein
MATWGAHFRIAENLLKKYPKLNRKLFAIGNIAPDGGVPNDDWSAFTRSKEITHFTIDNTSDFLEAKTDKFILGDVKFYSKYLKDYEISSLQDDKSILLGYFIHIITDNLWNYYIMNPLKKKYLKELKKYPNFIWEVKKDWYDLDKIYLTENKDSLFWTDFLGAEYNEDHLDFLPREGIRRQMEYIKRLYQISTEEYSKITKKEFKFLQKNQMNNFVQDSTDVILRSLEQIITNKINLKGKISVLDDIIFWD